ncbi:MAG: chromosome segregation and condensation protein ScpB [Pseudomonadota bacterium]|jgi:segregation and condensation protein B
MTDENVTAEVVEGVTESEGVAPGTEVVEAPEVEGREEGTLDSRELDLAALIEALLFASGEPLAPEKLCEVARCDEAAFASAIRGIEERLKAETSGFMLVQVAGKYQLRTKPQFADFIRELRASRPRRLSQPALETLAIVAYRQPIVKSDIEKIRGVDVSPTLKTLLDRNIIKIVGRQPTVGQPALYGTTEEFLKLFGLNSLTELPTLRDIKELEREPGESEDDEGDEAAVEGVACGADAPEAAAETSEPTPS